MFFENNDLIKHLNDKNNKNQYYSNDRFKIVIKYLIPNSFINLNKKQIHNLIIKIKNK